MRNFSAESKVKMSGSEIESEQGLEVTIFFFYENIRTASVSFIKRY